MNRPATVLMALSLSVLSTPQAATPQSAGGTKLELTTCPNPIEREPLVLYEVTGGTLAGTIDYSLSVNNDGSARLSTFRGDGPGSCQLIGVDPLEAEALRVALAGAGALSECDQPDITSDVPLQTLTVFRTGSMRRSNTFSWFTSDGSLADIQALLDAFIGAHFAPLPGGGPSGG